MTLVRDRTFVAQCFRYVWGNGVRFALSVMRMSGLPFILSTHAIETRDNVIMTSRKEEEGFISI